jgi:hypothetical protein
MNRLAALAASLVLGLAGLTMSTPAQAATEVLPDLKMRPPANFYIQNTPNEKRLRFDTIVWNAGAGKFEVRMARPATATQMDVFQHIYRSDGSYRRVAVSGTHGFYAGDGHDHWHVFKLQEFTISPYNATTKVTGTPVGRGAKTGFCFFDNVKRDLTLPGAPTTPKYTHCGVKASTVVYEGLSVGWGDRYSATTAYQWIKINGLRDGTYRVQVIADPKNWFAEKADNNNTSSAYIRITGNTVTMLSV